MIRKTKRKHFHTCSSLCAFWFSWKLLSMYWQKCSLPSVTINRHHMIIYQIPLFLSLLVLLTNDYHAFSFYTKDESTDKTKAPCELRVHELGKKNKRKKKQALKMLYPVQWTVKLDNFCCLFYNIISSHLEKEASDPLADCFCCTPVYFGSWASVTRLQTYPENIFIPRSWK